MARLQAARSNDSIVESLMVDIQVTGNLPQQHKRLMTLDLGFYDFDYIEQLQAIHAIGGQRKQLDRCYSQDTFGHFSTLCQFGQFLLMHREVKHGTAAGRPLGLDDHMNCPAFIGQASGSGATNQHLIIGMGCNDKGNLHNFILVILISAITQSGFRLARLNSRQNCSVSRNAGE